jgi:hypothetical protein
MALISGYGGTVNLAFQSASGAVFPIKNISVQYERASIDITQLSDFREKRAPGRVRRTVTFDMMAQNSTTDDALRTHLYPTTLADAVNRSVVVTFTDQGSIVYAITGHIVSASRSDDGTQAGMWNVSVEEA